jgi:hypothetical protein
MSPARKSTEERHSRFIRVGLTPGEYDQLAALARKRNVTIAFFIRRIIAKEARDDAF